MKESNDWNATKYNKHADYVSNLGMPVIDLLNPQKNEIILDLGCGEGTLALQIQKFNTKVVALDLSADMVEKTKAKGIEAYVMSATELEFKNEFDAVFSNAVLHWVKDSNTAITKIHTALKDKGSTTGTGGMSGTTRSVTRNARPTRTRIGTNRVPITGITIKKLAIRNKGHNQVDTQVPISASVKFMISRS